ncbi:hypothetical protein KFE25_012532 [Diacronema lutheri]|uniref:Peptidase A1 domain-containing protein n=3 Tax=Diacronema lutheri TaxID=2081491 RepID=A0A8J5XRB9_DIALT|nr:hypothetical protein KFE25_012532 [Diacronema lutheri]
MRGTVLVTALVAAGALVGMVGLVAPDVWMSAALPALLSQPRGRARAEYVLPLEPIAFHSRGQIQTRMRIGGDEYVMMVDSASADIAVVMRDCLFCSKHRSKYAPGPNASRVACDAAANGGVNCSECVVGVPGGKQCGYGVGYADGSSIRTLVFEDLVAFGGAPPVRAHVGGVYVESEGFEPKSVDGILGLGMRGLTSLDQPTALDALVAAGAIEDRFSLCMREAGGELVLGGGASPSHGVYQWTPLVDGPLGFYAVRLEAVEVDDVRVPVSNETLAVGGVVIDSGSSAVLLPAGTYSGLASTFRAACLARAEARVDQVQCMQISRRQCIDPSEKLLSRLPPISLRFANASWIFDRGSDSTGHIIGAAALRPFHNVLDRAAMRYGFAPLRGDSCAPRPS